ncbi:MAG: putative bifunctional diguanylate cyclase/phosphodiesterase [Bradymonadaceae bacterium]
MPWKVRDETRRPARLTSAGSEHTTARTLCAPEWDWLDESFGRLDECVEWLDARRSPLVLLDCELVDNATDEQWSALEDAVGGATLVLVGEPRAPGVRTRAVRHGFLGPVTEADASADALESRLERTVRRNRRRARQRRLSAALESAPVGMILTDPSLEDNPIVYCNRTFEQLTGYEASEVLGRNCRFLQCDETADEPVRIVGRAIDEQRSVSTVLLNERADGEPFWNELTIAPVRDERGEVAHFIGFQRDVTRRVRAENELQQYRLAVEHAPDPIFVKDRDGRYVLANEATCEMLEVPHDDLIGTTAVSVVGKEVVERWNEHAEEAIEKGETVRRRVDVEMPKGDRVFHVTRAPVYEGDDPTGTIGIARDVTEQHRLREELEEQALRDPLTGLSNRRNFQERCRSLAETYLEEQRPLTVAVLDLDDFNTVNESFGRDAGDELLKRVARRLTDAVSEPGFVARIGGDEFVMQLPSVQSRAEMANFADHLEDAFAAPIEIDERPVHVSYSLGFAHSRDVDAESMSRDALVDHLCRAAEGAAREAKRVCGASWRVSSLNADRTESDRIRLEHRIRTGLDAGEFVPFFHPIYELESRQLRALELLARWRHPDEGIVSPGRFLPIAERAGLLPELTEQLLEKTGEALEDLAPPNQHAPTSHLYVNLSPSEVARSNIAEQMRRLVDRTLPDTLTVSLEITEGQLLESRERVESLRAAGFRIIVDDFGTGYSSLTRIKELPMDELKLDMEFVQGAVEHASDRAILRTVAELGRQLDVPVVGEGVETEPQLDCLQDAGCTAAQGYLFGRPAPLEQIELHGNSQADCS